VEADGKTRERLRDPRLLPGIKTQVAGNIQRRGGPQNLLISSFPATPELEGKNLLEISRALGETPVDAAIDVMLMGGASVTSFNMSEDDIEFFMKKPYVLTCSDGDIIRFGKAVPHPRSYGAFTRKIRHYVIDRKVISMEQAIRAATGLPAQVLAFRDRGLIREGYAADVVVFDPEMISDKSTFARPHRYSEGINFVLVNGRLAVDQGRLTGILAGIPLPPSAAR
jgi:N-acyl-D-aspartate/D-glutamate deacylase